MLSQNVVANSHPATYRAEIDGLRAVAVLSVVGFHAFPTFLPGGFIGVDIFFVISGYLISNIIFREVDQGSFSYADFYSRRIRRIFPALAVMLGACLLFASVFLFPNAAAQLGLHTAAGSLFASNLLLWTESGYFDSDSALKPLLHLWSLGIEEQYYLLWPLVIGASQHRLKLRLGVLVVLTFASFGLNLVLLKGQPVSTFYLPFTRFWELLIGAGLAYLTLYGRTALWAPHSSALSVTHARRLCEVLAWSGALLIMTGLITLRSTQPFPGWRALLPTLGAAFVIAGGRGAWLNRNLLSTPVAVFFGTISYPLYLWHWPLLTFPNVLDGEGSRNVRIAAVAVSIVLAWGTYRFVERPIRSGPLRRPMTVFLVATVGALGICGLAMYLSDGLPQRYPVALRNIALADQKFDYALYRERECFLTPDQGPSAFVEACVQPRVPGHDKLMLLWGDSHAASFYPGLHSALATDGLSYRLAQYTASACPPVFGFSVSHRPNCRSTNDFVLQFIKEQRPDTVVMLASWSFYAGGEFDRLDLAEIARTVERIRSLGVRKVVVLGPLPRWLEHQPNIVLREWRRRHSIVERTFAEFDTNVISFDERIDGALAGMPSTFVSPIRILCKPDGCPIVTRRDDQLFPMAWDDAHLTVEGSRTVARALLPLILQ